ncbi:DEAD/DEAH box helicase [Clostridium paraputrificum]|uniref:DEAD/DEAH box helicase n=1 Tax=Clostridium TaxID=1485 RepID=UPI00232AA9DD|nr:MULTISPECIES: DEAD/DEAH box helicase [Clostridium]MDB2089208.1 DEAD/DEAH box helicase [Clostridium paraputrificum]MDB2095664.1 DEAD/DEAH box helicase [Clostridium paraputrificum]MDU1180801.1 DEAD/DEAH box helicase [Clostridium sp.]MDU1227305.1 DEAD/DEAH box helicase [Clostridium sp.]MDU7653365.1 DEAD/DEAH box helicase [Clostridium sp.]
MTFLEELVDSAIKDPYLEELINKAELIYAYSFLKKNSNIKLSEKEYYDILRFADILCRDKNYLGKNKAFKIISLLFDSYKEDLYFQHVTTVIMVKLGNFPSLNLALDGKKVKNNIEINLEKEVKMEYQRVPNSDKFFTDMQYQLFEALKDSNHYSFSGPTSFGKSFIMDAFIRYIINQRQGVDNIVILVPTRALINQVSNRLKKEINDSKYKVLSHPIVPLMYKNKEFKYIFIFTPERLITYLSDISNPVISYMFIDEAQKIIGNNDSRSPLYYHAILLAERKSIKLYFASPNIPNADIFLQLFEKSTDENMVINESSVSQNRFFIDLIEKKEIIFLENTEYIESQCNRFKSFEELLFKLGSGYKNIIYCNSVSDTIKYALKFATYLPSKNSEKLQGIIELVEEYMHKDYFLVDCLKKGIAFHFGRLPQRIREQVEILFEEKSIDYMFCTSTLLEGVNMPAKNIFILNNMIGLRKFSDIDFWNLAGRAGRLSKELSGNIICVRAEDKKWKNIKKNLEVVRNKQIKKVVPTVIKGEKNFYANLQHSLSEERFTKSKYSQTEKEIWDHYANIVYLHQVSGTQSILINNFMKKNSNATKLLEKINKENVISNKILEQSSSIKGIYQNKIWKNAKEERAFPKEVTFDNCYKLLCILYSKYNWSKEESGGKNPLAKEISQMKYFAMLMYYWMNSKPLNLIILKAIRYYKIKGSIWYQGEMIQFNDKDKMHINIVINNLISDIENLLRFKIKNYVHNYYLLIEDRYGKEVAGENWADYLEYGTTDSAIIELQNIGIPRHLALLIRDKYKECIIYEDCSIIDFDDKLLVKIFDKDRYPNEFLELKSIFY